MVILSGMGESVCKISHHGCVIPKARVFTSGPRDLPLICCRLGPVFIAPILRQVLPTRIHRFDELDLLAPSPAFDFLFAGNSGIGIEESFVINEAGQVVSAGESEDEFLLVLPDAVRKIARDAGIEDGRFGAIGHDVDEKLLGRAHRFCLAQQGWCRL